MRENSADPLTRGEWIRIPRGNLFAVEPDPVQVQRLRVECRAPRQPGSGSRHEPQSAWLVAGELDPGF